MENDSSDMPRFHARSSPVPSGAVIIQLPQRPDVSDFPRVAPKRGHRRLRATVRDHEGTSYTGWVYTCAPWRYWLL